MSKKPAHETLRECIAVRIRMLNRLVTRNYDTELRPFGVTTAQVNLLVAIANRGPIRARDLAALLQLEKSTLSRDLRRMKDSGLLREAATDDGLGVATTAKGRRLLEKLLPAWRRAQRLIRNELGADFIQALHASADRLWAQASPE